MSKKQILSGCGKLNEKQCYRTVDEIESLIKEHQDDDEFFSYAMGFKAGLSFVACPKDAATHGYTIADYLENAYVGYLKRCLSSAIKDIFGCFAKSHDGDSDGE